MKLPDMSKVVQPDADSAKGIAATNQNIDEYKNATKPTFTAEPVKEMKPASVDKINPTARYGVKSGEDRIDTRDYTKPLGSFKHGTNHVPATGTYKLHEGEAVIPKEKNAMMNKDKMIADMSDEGKSAPKKEIKEMVHRKTKNGKHIIVHKHHSPAHHPDEEHALENMAEVHQHMEDHAGEPNEGEGAESAPQGGAPAQMTAAPSAPAMPGQGGM